jgi:hypothetical protein
LVRQPPDTNGQSLSVRQPHSSGSTTQRPRSLQTVPAVQSADVQHRSTMKQWPWS